MRDILLSIAALLTPVAAVAASPFDMRFHCDSDTIVINELLKKGYDSGLESPNELVAFYAGELVGSPYVAGTLEDDDKEYLTIDVHEFDCMTLVETLYALARSTLDGRYSWRDYARNLESVRYRGGEMGDYSSRLHYVSDWIVNNSYRGNITEVTASFEGARTATKTINYMTANRGKYPRLIDDDEMYEKVKNFEIGYRLHRYPYIKKEWVFEKKIKAGLKPGDIIAILTKTEGLDVAHMGVIAEDGGTYKLLHASSTAGVVKIEKDDLRETLRLNRNWTAIRVIRLVK